MSAVGRFAPPIALMALIFYLSSQPGLGSGLSFDFVLRKLAHMTEFGLLWLLVNRALDWKGPRAAAVIAVTYAISDELHQATVDGRNGTPVDVVIDAVGVALAALLLRASRARWR